MNFLVPWQILDDDMVLHEEDPNVVHYLIVHKEEASVGDIRTLLPKIKLTPSEPTSKSFAMSCILGLL